MSPLREIKGKQILTDIRSGLTDSQLREKYKLTQAGLENVFKQLVAIRAIGVEELNARSTGSTVIDEFDLAPRVRVTPRDEVDFPLSAYEIKHPLRTGYVRDISEHGLGTRGIPSDLGQIMTLVVRADEFFQTDPVVVDVKCCWTERDDHHDELLAGFEVVRSLKGGLHELQQLIQALSFEDREALKKAT
jgi:hypothetical protein